MNLLDKTREHRYDFKKGKLEEFKYDQPMLFFQECYQAAHENNCADPHAFTLSTVKDNQPSSRIVYMRDYLEEGFVFYTNYHSKKGQHIQANPKVSLLFYWDCNEMQVRVEGTVEKLDESLSDDYFAARPRISQIGAWASAQSELLDDRSTLEERVKQFEQKFPNEVPRPPHWGGYLIRPHYFEFWQGRVGRLHDRLCYRLEGEIWKKFRISP